MLRSKFHICGIDSCEINGSIADTAQFYLITILIRYGMWTLPEKDLGRFGKIYKDSMDNLKLAGKSSVTLFRSLY
jgi:hypothetical protein